MKRAVAIVLIAPATILGYLVAGALTLGWGARLASQRGDQ